MLKALAKNGGVIGINFFPGFLNAEIDEQETVLRTELLKKHNLPDDWAQYLKADPEKQNQFMKEFETRLQELKKTLPAVNVKTVVDHIEHVIQVTGNSDHVGLGSDFDGISSTPEGLDNAGKLMNITAELVRRGHSAEDIRKILGGNFVRVLRKVCNVQETN
jgi:membrane dipeptidase